MVRASIQPSLHPRHRRPEPPARIAIGIVASSVYRGVWRGAPHLAHLETIAADSTPSARGVYPQAKQRSPYFTATPCFCRTTRPIVYPIAPTTRAIPRPSIQGLLNPERS